MDNFNLLFSILCIAASGVMILAGIIFFLNVSFTNLIIGIYMLLFGSASLMMEIFMPKFVKKWIPFYCSWIGKAAYYLFFGVLILTLKDYGNKTVAYICGPYVIGLAIVLIIVRILAACSVHEHKMSHSIISGNDDEDPAS